MTQRGLILINLLCLGLSAKADAASPRMAVAELHADSTACIAASGPALRQGDRFWVVVFDPPRIVDGVIVATAAAPCSLKGLSPSVPYRAQMRFAVGSNDELGIAVFAPGSRAEFLDGEFVLNTPEAKTPLSFRRCTSQEGVHLTTWRGNRRTWHEYVYLGFDLEPSCSEEETK